MNSQTSFIKVTDILSKYKPADDKYISREFQKYGYDLAEELGDLPHKALYIKLAKDSPRGLLEAARSFVKDALNVNNKGKLFMWKLAELRRKPVDTQEERRR